eukprot:m.347224 g.347224  ORF g.347224 m.347224 type:complete len:804 (+) comp16144_c0_seq24:2229-4640(+)
MTGGTLSRTKSSRRTMTRRSLSDGLLPPESAHGDHDSHSPSPPRAGRGGFHRQQQQIPPQRPRSQYPQHRSPKQKDRKYLDSDPQFARSRTPSLPHISPSHTTLSTSFSFDSGDESPSQSKAGADQASMQPSQPRDGCDSHSDTHQHQRWRSQSFTSSRCQSRDSQTARRLRESQPEVLLSSTQTNVAELVDLQGIGSNSSIPQHRYFSGSPDTSPNASASIRREHVHEGKDEANVTAKSVGEGTGTPVLRGRARQKGAQSRVTSASASPKSKKSSPSTSLVRSSASSGKRSEKPAATKKKPSRPKAAKGARQASTAASASSPKTPRSSRVKSGRPLTQRSSRTEDGTVAKQERPPRTRRNPGKHKVRSRLTAPEPSASPKEDKRSTGRKKKPKRSTKKGKKKATKKKKKEQDGSEVSSKDGTSAGGSESEATDASRLDVLETEYLAEQFEDVSDSASDLSAGSDYSGSGSESDESRSGSDDDNVSGDESEIEAHRNFYGGKLPQSHHDNDVFDSGMPSQPASFTRDVDACDHATPTALGSSDLTTPQSTPVPHDTLTHDQDPLASTLTQANILHVSLGSHPPRQPETSVAAVAVHRASSPGFTSSSDTDSSPDSTLLLSAPRQLERRRDRPTSTFSTATTIANSQTSPVFSVTPPIKLDQATVDASVTAGERLSATLLDDEDYDILEAMSLARVALASRAEDYDDEPLISDPEPQGATSSFLTEYCKETLGDELFHQLYSLFMHFGPDATSSTSVQDWPQPFQDLLDERPTAQERVQFEEACELVRSLVSFGSRLSTPANHV